MRDIYPKKPELPKKRRAENKKPLKKGRSSLFRKAPATPDMRTKLFFKTKSQPQLFSFRTIISAFIIALLIVLGYLFRDELKDKLKIIRQIAGEKIKKLNLISELPPAEIKVEQPKEKITPLVYFAVQTNEKVDIKWAGKALNNEQTETKTQTSIREQGKTIYSFISNTSIYDGTISISNNYPEIYEIIITWSAPAFSDSQTSYYWKGGLVWQSTDQHIPRNSN